MLMYFWASLPAPALLEGRHGAWSASATNYITNITSLLHTDLFLSV